MEREELIKLIMKRIHTRRIYAEGLADDILRLFSVVGQSEQLPTDEDCVSAIKRQLNDYGFKTD